MAAAAITTTVTRINHLKITADYLLEHHVQQICFKQQRMQNFHHKIGIKNWQFSQTLGKEETFCLLAIFISNLNWVRSYIKYCTTVLLLLLLQKRRVAIAKSLHLWSDFMRKIRLRKYKILNTGFSFKWQWETKLKSVCYKK